MSQFFSRLSYSFGNEDWRSDREALKIQANDRVLSITASGDRPLHLLLDECKEVVSIDANPIQNYLLNLKCVAMRELNYLDYLKFLGASPCNHRLSTLEKLVPHMEEQAQKFWVKKKKLIQKGVLYQGVVEKGCKGVASPLLKLFGRKKIKRLFEFSNIEDQREFVASWHQFYWKKIFDFALNSFISRWFLKCVFNDPGLYDHLNESVSIGTYLYQRINEGLRENLARESLLFSLIVKGRVSHDAFPPYLTESGVNCIKDRINRLTVRNVDILSFLKSTPDQSFDCFSLSDVASYLNPTDFLTMLKEVQRVAKPGARFSIRQFLSNHQVPKEMESFFQRDSALEKKLEKEDRCFVYRFMAGTIHKT